MNKNKIMGAITISLIVGGAIYCIKKYRDSLDEEGPITVDDARALWEKRKAELATSTQEVGEALGVEQSEIEELVEEARDEASWNTGVEEPNDEYDYYDDVDWNTPLADYITEEDRTLRFEADSIQARDQFIKMELAGLLPGQQEYQIMKRLFEFQFEPLNDGDEILYSQLADYRSEFFGEHSRWNDNITIGDIITYFARRIDYNVGGGDTSWIIHILEHIGVSELDSSEKIGSVISDLNKHVYENNHKDTYGLFGLHFDDVYAAEEMAGKTVDGQLTYDIEFNTFLNTFN